MWRIAFAKACRGAVCAAVGTAAPNAARSATNLLSEAGGTSIYSHGLLESPSSALLARVQFAFPQQAGAPRWRTGVSSKCPRTAMCKPTTAPHHVTTQFFSAINQLQPLSLTQPSGSTLSVTHYRDHQHIPHSNACMSTCLAPIF